MFLWQQHCSIVLDRELREAAKDFNVNPSFENMGLSQIYSSAFGLEFKTVEHQFGIYAYIRIPEHQEILLFPSVQADTFQ